MIISYASNAVLSKARAMYGKRITKKNYEELISCRNIPDVVSYLKKKTSYGSVLKDLNEIGVHRNDLEERLKLKLFRDFEILGRYDISVGEHFCDYFVSRAEVEQFMHIIMLISAGMTGESIFPIPDFFYDHTKVDFTAVETSLHNYLYEIVFKIIDTYVKGKAKRELKDFFNLYIDLSNMIRIVRMKKFYKLTPSYMMQALISGGTLKREKLESFVCTPDNKQMMTDMKNTSMGKKWFSRNLDIVDKVPKNMRFNWCKHNIRFSSFPPVVLVSYIFLEETEILNIITIIEGIKYRLSPDEIRKMLII